MGCSSVSQSDMSQKFRHACYSVVCLLKGHLSGPLMRKKMLANQLETPRGRQVAPGKGSARAVCIAWDPGKPFLSHPPAQGLRLGLAAERLK